MNLPGFTAEASIYMKSSEYLNKGIIIQANQSVQPAYIRRWGCMQKCISNCSENDPYCYDNCECICFGHPGRDCWPM